MSSYFDEKVNRKKNSGTYSSKWQGYKRCFPGFKIDAENSIAMWVADMDFLCPLEVIDAVVNRAKHGIYGYSSLDSNTEFKKSAASWFKRKYNLETDVEWMIFSPGIVPAINAAIQEFSDIHNGVIIQSPVYYPFTDGIKNNDRLIVNNALIEKDSKYQIDFDDLEMKAKDTNNKLLILANPHNPVGRVWTYEEMQRLCKICFDNNVLLVSDEIHGDLIFKGHKLTSAGIFKEFNNNLIAMHAPSKTFNLAGLGASIITVPNENIRKRMEKRLLMNRLPASNIFGPIAGAAAYKYGDDYVKKLIDYIHENIKYAIEFQKKYLSNIKIIKPEGTYLVWIDFRGTGLSSDEINRKIIEDAKIIVDLGEWFGNEGKGFLRFNFACPKDTVIEAMDRIKVTFKS